MDFSKVKEGMYIEYIGRSSSFDGTYKVISAESTYTDPRNCPKSERGTLMIIEFANDDSPMFFPLKQLKAKDWIIAE